MAHLNPRSRTHGYAAARDGGICQKLAAGSDDGSGRSAPAKLQSEKLQCG
jgi:hypothetical protein